MAVQIPMRTEPDEITVPLWVQVLAWLVGLAACIAGMLDLVAEWSPFVATVQFLALMIAPVILMLPRRSRSGLANSGTTVAVDWNDWLACLLVGWVSLTTSSAIGTVIGDLPPAYHDEFSYLFQAKLLLSGRFSVPGHPVHPELFDQMHVLNEGRMASRYYPGTGLWLVPFVAAGHPYLGQWIAGSIASMLVFWTGREIAGRQTGFIAGLAMALSPGVGLFGNTLLAHHPTLLSLTAFLFAVARWQRTRSAVDAWIAGCGLSFAMLCRPMTAAATGLPFGIDIALWLLVRRQRDNPLSPVPSLLGFGIPLIIGWAIMLGYNHSVTGELLKSPYQLYTDVYTPRHVYGFNNVVRGEQHLGPKVIDAYDRWAENLTPQLAVRNVLVRWISSWIWTFDVLPLLISTIIVLGLLPRLDRRWLLVVSAIISLHLLHAPYWYVGIMGWHYVFESAPLWCLILGGATQMLVRDWKRRGLFGLPIWWYLVLVISVLAIYLPRGQTGKSRMQRGLNALEYPRHRHAELRQWLEQRIVERPALVLLEQDERKLSHLDLVVNEPGLNAELLWGRFRIGQTDVDQIRRDFPDRHLYVANPERGTFRQIGH